MKDLIRHRKHLLKKVLRNVNNNGSGGTTQMGPVVNGRAGYSEIKGQLARHRLIKNSSQF